MTPQPRARRVVTTFGVVVLLAAVLAASDGQTGDAVLGVVLGSSMIILNEWNLWRKR